MTKINVIIVNEVYSPDGILKACVFSVAIIFTIKDAPRIIRTNAIVA